MFQIKKQLIIRFRRQFQIQLNLIEIIQTRELSEVSKKKKEMNHFIANAVAPQATSSFSIPIKICDGLFMSDHYIAQDNQFFETNLITHVINCAGQEIENNKKICNVIFLTFDWSENVIQNITEQKIINVTVNFIEECKKQSGCLLIHYFNSQSRPFCLLACYFMVKFKWSLFKTLQFLNSRKQDVQLQPAFFEQLTLFAQKLQDKGLIKSKTWLVNPSMNYQQIIITNTYLNSKNKFTQPVSNQISNTKSIKNKSVSWKKDLAIQYKYCPNSTIQQKFDSKQKQKDRIANEKIQKGVTRKNIVEGIKNQRNQINNSRDRNQDNGKKIIDNQMPSRTSLIQDKSSVNPSMSQMNVTKKWAELRELWLKQKQNNNTKTNANKNKQFCYSQPQQKQQNPTIAKDNQKFNDRLQQKLNLLKKHQQKLQTTTTTTTTTITQPQKKQCSPLPQPPPPQSAPQLKTKSQNSTHQNSHQSQQNNNRVLYNNWIIDNHQVINDNLIQKNNKNKFNHSHTTCNKSVIIVKPNHCSSSLDTKPDKQKDKDGKCMERLKNNSMINSHAVLRQNLRQNINNSGGSRNSLRKPMGSQRKQNNNSSLNKENKQHSGTGSKFFRNQATQIITTKGRCSSAKPQRRDNFNNQIPIGLGLSKNSSLKSKGKWQF